MWSDIIESKTSRISMNTRKSDILTKQCNLRGLGAEFREMIRHMRAVKKNPVRGCSG
jgi:hypothetical protein